MRDRVPVYALLGCLASALQFGVYDCNGVLILSFVAGALTVFTALVVIDRVYTASISPGSAGPRLAVASGTGILGAGVVFAMGWFTRMTHMCG